jgi:hypothetical protein
MAFAKLKALLRKAADERRLLGLLAASGSGCTDVLLLEHGFPLEMIAEVCAPDKPHETSVVS